MLAVSLFVRCQTNFSNNINRVIVHGSTARLQHLPDHIIQKHFTLLGIRRGTVTQTYKRHPHSVVFFWGRAQQQVPQQ